LGQLIVRNLEDTVVRALQERAGRNGQSAEAEHRDILRRALTTSRGATRLKDLLQGMPDAGDDADFARVRAKGRVVKL
jgi:plasmid stability protein